MTRTGLLILGDYLPVCAIVRYRQGVLPIWSSAYGGYMKTFVREVVEFFGFCLFGATCFAPLFFFHLIYSL